MNHSQTETNTCQKHAEEVSAHLKDCQNLSELMRDAAERCGRAAAHADGAEKRAARSAERAEGSEKRALRARYAATEAAFRADLFGHDAKAAAIVATEAAQRSLKATRAIMLSLMLAILAYAAIHFFTH